jgi:Fe-Mn family superoxide dismutase
MFSLIELPYKSLAPVISDETLSFHHGKHLQTYVDNLNKLIAGTEFEKMSLEEIVVASSLPAATGNPAMFNNAGQILNHNLYFSQFVMPGSDRASGTPHPGLDPGSPLSKQIVKQWGSLDAFKSDFESKGTTLFGSGWVWLQANEAGELSIAQYPNADNPVAHGLRPLLTFDVWEHAYYLDYQNKRAAHLNALWGIVNWNEIEARYTK